MLLKKLFKDYLPLLFYGFRNKYFSLILLENRLYFHSYILTVQGLRNTWFFDKHAIKNNVQNKMQITLFAYGRE